MKKIVPIYLALWSILAFSCTREEIRDAQPVIGDGVPITAQTPGSLPTKSAVDDGSGIFTWTAGDQLAVFAVHEKYGERYYTANLPAEEVGKTTSTFKLDYYGERKNFAVYPATHALDSHPTADDLRITIPANYKMAISEPAMCPPMVAINEEGQDLQFHHVCGLLRLTLNQVPVNTNRIKVWLGENIVGIFQVDMSDSDHPFVSIDNPVAAGSSQDVTFTLKAAVTSGTQNGIVLNVPLPEGVYYNLGLTFYTSLDSNWASELRLYKGEKRVIKAGYGYHETIDCSVAVKKNLWNVSVPATTVTWGATATVTPTVEVTTGNKNDISSENALALDMELVCFTEDPSIATAYVQPIAGTARPQIVIKGISPGVTYIRARARYGTHYKWSSRTQVTVVSNNSSYMPSVSYPRFMTVGDRYVLKASLTGNFEYRNYSWEQLDGFDYATVTSGGLITALAVGTVHVGCTVTTNEGSVEKYPLTIKIVKNPAGTARGVFTASKYGDAVFFSSGNLIYYKADLGNGVYEDYDNTYDPDNMSGHFEFMSPQYELYSGRYNSAIISRTFVPQFDLFNFRLTMNYFSDASSARPVEVDGSETFGWHAPSRHQWDFILKSRPCSTVGGVSNARFAKATISHLPIGDISGLIIFPDCYTHPEGLPVPSGINEGNYAFTSNKYSPAEWDQMEQEGAVFLPNRGYNSTTTNATSTSKQFETSVVSVLYNNTPVGVYWDNVAVKGEGSTERLSFYYLHYGSIGWAEYEKGTDPKKWLMNVRLVKDVE